MSNIFNISERLLQAYELAETGDVDNDTISATIESIEWERDEKADNYANFIAVEKGNIETIDKEIERLRALKRAKENFIKVLKDNLYASMIMTNTKKFKTTLHSYWIQANPPALVVTNETEIPKEYFIPQPDALDTASLKNDLLNGEIVDGAKIVRGEGVRFR